MTRRPLAVPLLSGGWDVYTHPHITSSDDTPTPRLTEPTRTHHHTAKPPYGVQTLGTMSARRRLLEAYPGASPQADTLHAALHTAPLIRHRGNLSLHHVPPDTDPCTATLYASNEHHWAVLTGGGWFLNGHTSAPYLPNPGASSLTRAQALLQALHLFDDDAEPAIFARDSALPELAYDLARIPSSRALAVLYGKRLPPNLLDGLRAHLERTGATVIHHTSPTYKLARKLAMATPPTVHTTYEAPAYTPTDRPTRRRSHRVDVSEETWPGAVTEIATRARSHGWITSVRAWEGSDDLMLTYKVRAIWGPHHVVYTHAIRPNRAARGGTRYVRRNGKFVARDRHGEVLREWSTQTTARVHEWLADPAAVLSQLQPAPNGARP